jgi:cytochrome c
LKEAAAVWCRGRFATRQQELQVNKKVSIVIAATLLSVASAVFAAGDATRGKELYESRCVACHSVDASRVGPAHQGVFGRRAGRVVGYNYSAALKASRVVWSEKTLDAWLASPERTIPGQKMGYSVTEAVDRADLIAYLRAVSP